MRFGRTHKILKPNQKRNKYSAFIFRTGQAAAELAILGSLVLVAFSSLITYGQRIDAQQALKQEAFRKALQKSYQRNANVSYTLKKDNRFYNALANFGESQPSTLTASASVMWQKGMAGCQHDEHGCHNKKEDNDSSTIQGSFSYYEVNNQFVGTHDWETARVGNPDVMLTRYPKAATDPTGGDDTWSKVPSTVWRDVTAKHTQLTSTSRKHQLPAGEGPARISNTQRMELSENIESTVFLRRDTSVSQHDADDGSPAEGDWELLDPQDLAQGAWYDTNDNRIKYDPNTINNPDNRVIINRTWDTNF